MRYFDYIQPENIKQASESAGRDWRKALLYAGGTDLLGLIKNEVESPAALINLKAIPGLNGIEYSEREGLTIGALVKLSQLSAHEVVREKYSVLEQALKETASPQLRNMGTIGGNLCQRPRCWYFRGDFHCLRKGGDICYAVDGENKYHCVIGGGPCFIVHPSDPAVALLTLDAGVTIASAKGTKRVALKDFFVLPEDDIYRENILQPGEIVTHIHVPPVSEKTVSGYIKFRERGAWDFAVVSVAATLRINGDTIIDGKAAFGGVAPKPWQEEKINQKLKGLSVKPGNFESLSAEVLKEAEPLNQNAFKLPLVRNLLKRLLVQLTAS
ncbi:MAG: xanthine dehydrogenase family protein subunit M [Calditrichaeota bacterium]|nr:xanthine dehydrogenase family protein subunit M [Calditrichota bacterium]